MSAMPLWELIPWIAAGVMGGAVAIEGIVSYFVRRDGHYALADTFTSIAITVGYVLVRIGLGAVIAVLLLGVYELTPLRWSMAHWWHWLVLFVLYDFFYYWSHRASHTWEVMWASHAVHHNSAHLNLSTGLRNSWTGGAIDWVFLVPVVAVGCHPLALGVVLALGATWDFLCHTPYVGRLPIIDFLFNSPSNHRVHHANSARYIDKNLGGTLIIWDRMFGTYAPEPGKLAYGTLDAPRRPHDPFYLELYLWGRMLRRMRG